MNVTNIPGKAGLLGYAGVIPFIAAVVLMGSTGPELKRIALDAFLVYGAVILSFLGGIRWGAAATAKSDANHALVVSVLPSLWAFVCLLLPSSEASVWALMTGFMLVGLADWLYPGLGVASWMRPLRIRLTLLVILFHLLAIGLI